MINLTEIRDLIDDEIPRAKHSVERAMAKATKCTASLTGMPRGGTGGNQVERGVELLEMARAELSRLENELFSMQTELKPRIDALETPNERRVLMLRYMHGMSCDDVADIMGYCKRHTMRILRRAESHLDLENVIACPPMSL